MALALVPLTFWMGIRSAGALAVVATATVLSCVCALTYSFLAKPPPLLRHAVFVLGLAAIVGLYPLFGPWVLVPPALFGHVAAFTRTRDNRERAWTVGVGLVVLIAVLGGEWSGWLPASYRFSGDALIIQARLASFPEVPTRIYVSLMLILLYLSPLLQVWRLQEQLDQAQRRGMLQGWHLRQMVGAAGPRPPG